MGRPVCVRCERWFRCRKNGVVVSEEGCRVWEADLYVCEGCGVEVIVGFGKKVVAEVWQEGFEGALKCVTHVVRG